MTGRSFKFPVYQIDFSAVASGKRVAATKRRVRWRFGFPNQEALQQGLTGTDCRGEEHEVVIVWSVTSGKRQVMMDGKEVHYSTNRTGILDHTWSTRGNHIMKVMCHAAPPMSANPNFRQYDLFIDGQTFFAMPKVYELGLRGAIPAHDRVPGGISSSPRSYAAGGDAGGGGGGGPSRIHVPHDRAEEEAELQRAINASLEESRQHLARTGINGGPPPAPAPAGGGDLLALDGPSDGFDAMSYTSAPTVVQPSPVPQPSQNSFAALPPSQQQYQQQQAPPSYPSSNAGAASFPALPASSSYPAANPPPPVATNYAAAPPPQYAGGTPTSSYSAPPPQQQFGGPPPSPYAPQPAQGTLLSTDAGAGIHAADDPFAPKPPSHNDIANEILSAYSPTSTPGGGVGSPQQQQPPYPPQPGQPYPGQQPYPPQQPGQPYGQPYPPQPGQPGDQQQRLTLENGGNQAAQSMNALAATEEEGPADPFAKAIKNLVNMDNIDQPAEGEVKLTIMKKEDEKLKKNQGKSRGLPPVAKNIVGTQATLSQISEVKQTHAVPSSPDKEIMKAPPQLFHPNAAAAGMLVVHGAPPPGAGPPPLQQQGFGMGYNMAYQQGYPPQQQQQYR